jgi:hypothetical protein
MLKRFLVNASLVLFSVIVGLALVEVYLNLTGRYESLVNGSSVASGTTIWTTAQNKTVYKTHPDLGYPVKEVLDNYGTRNEGAAYVPGKTGPVIGVFGDSFTENKNVEQQYTFIDLLNRYYGKTLFWNFGVDGFGPEQSFQRYMNVADDFTFSDVVYVFCNNDLQNTYQVQLLDIAEGPGGLVYANVYEGQSNARFLMSSLGKLRLTYLVLEGYYQLRAMLGLDSAQPSREQVAEDLNKQRLERMDDSFSTGLQKDFLSDNPSAETLAVAAKLKQVITLWKQEAEKRGSRFHIALLPFQQERDMMSKLFTEEERKAFGIFNLTPPRETTMFAGYTVQFKNDGHWNEIANLVVVPDFVAQFPSLQPASPRDMNAMLQAGLAKILALYAEHGGTPRKGVW